MRFWSTLSVLPALLVACGDASDLSLTAATQAESIVVQNGAFGETVSGQFSVRFELGSEAAGGSRLTLGNFSLQSESGASLAAPLDVLADQDFPLQIAKGQSITVHFTFPAASVEQGMAACPGPVLIVGSVNDQLKGGTLPIHSGKITPECPSN